MALEEYEVDALARELEQMLIVEGNGMDEPAPVPHDAMRAQRPLRAFTTSVAVALAGEAVVATRSRCVTNPWSRTYSVLALTATALVYGEATFGDSADGSDDESASVVRLRLADVVSTSVSHGAHFARDRQGSFEPTQASLDLVFADATEVSIIDDTSLREPRFAHGTDPLTVRGFLEALAAS